MRHDRHFRHRRGGTTATRVALTGVVMAGACAHAFQPKDIMVFSVGPVVVKPHLALSETYDDNVLYSGAGKESAFITTVTPSVNLRLGREGAENRITFNYAFSHLWYLDGPPSLDTAVSHNISLNAAFQRNRLTAQTSFTFAATDTVYGGYESFVQGEVGIVGSRNVERLIYGFNQNLGYQFSEKIEGHGSFNYTGTDFLDAGTYYDQGTWRVTGGAGYYVRPKIRVFSEVHYAQTSSDPNLSTIAKPPDMDTLGASVGVGFPLSDRLSGSAKIGYENNVWDDDQGDFGALIADLSVTAQLTDKTTATLSYNRSGSASIQSYASGYVGDRFALGLGQSIGTVRPVGLSLGISYGVNTYETGGIQGLSQDYFGVNFGISYSPMAWMQTALSYSYSKTSSDATSAIDYDSNRVMLTISIGY